MPKLYILGGANGVGKTTWYQTGIEQKYITAELPFINVDAIVLGCWKAATIFHLH